MFCPSVFTIDGHEFNNFQFRNLPHFKISDIILGLPVLKKLDAVIHPILNTFTMGDFTIHCNREYRRIDCIIVDAGKMNLIILKQTRNKKNPSNIFLISLHYAEELVIVKSDFGEQFDQKLKHLITKFPDMTDEPQGFHLTENT